MRTSNPAPSLVLAVYLAIIVRQLGRRPKHGRWRRPQGPPSPSRSFELSQKPALNKPTLTNPVLTNLSLTNPAVTKPALTKPALS